MDNRDYETKKSIMDVKTFVTPAEMARELERELRPHVERMIKEAIPYQSIVAAYKDAMPTQIMISSIVAMTNREMQAQIIGLEKKVKELRTREADAKREAVRADRLARGVVEKDREIGWVRLVELQGELDRVRSELAAAKDTSADTWKLEADRANQSNRELTERCEALSAQIRKVERDAERNAQAWEPAIRFAHGVVKFIERWKSGHVSGETHARELERWMTEAGLAVVGGYHPVKVGKYEEKEMMREEAEKEYIARHGLPENAFDR